MPDIKHQTDISATANTVYELIDNIDGLYEWLTKEEGWKITGEENLGGTLTFYLGEENSHEMKIQKLVPNKEVEWLCTKGHPEWLDTTVEFGIEDRGDECILSFGHNGWENKTDFFNQCNDAWATYMTNIKKAAEHNKIY